MSTCSACSNTGLIWLRHKKTLGSYAFKCYCALGVRYSYPQYETKLLSEYESEDSNLQTNVVVGKFLDNPRLKSVVDEIEDDDDDLCPF